MNDRSGSGELSSNIETIILGTRLLVRFWYSLHFHIQLPAHLGSPGKRAIKRVCVSYPYPVVGCWRGYLSGARCRLVHSPPDATATHSLASVKSRLVLPFWYRLTWVVPEKGPLNGCVCVCVHFHIQMQLTQDRSIYRSEILLSGYSSFV